MTFSARGAVDDLDAFFGVRGPIPAEPLVQLHKAGQAQQLVKTIGNLMGLPVEFRLSVASKDVRFHGHYLVKTDRTGRGVEGIEAQVAIPADLPLYGSAELRRYPVKVIIGPGFNSGPPETAITILAHELSHVLLHSLRHPQRESEAFTDLVPLVLGFIEIVQRGRIVSSVSREAGASRTTTTTYGYLSDAEFSAAADRVESLLGERQCRRSKLLRDTERLRVSVTRSSGLLSRFVKLKERLDNVRGHVRKSDAARVVAMHAPDFTRDIERTIRDALILTDLMASFAQSVAHYAKPELRELGEYEQMCAGAAARLDDLLLQLRLDVNVLTRNSGLGFRLAETLRTIIPRLARRARVR